MSDTGKTIALIKALGGGSGSGTSGGGVFVVDLVKDIEGSRLNKTWQEIYDAMETGIAVVKDSSDGMINSSQVSACGTDGEEYGVIIEGDNFATDTPSGYPSFSPNDDTIH